ncbi:NPCBM/NEW2 domain-containing protein [Clostridium perfringens]|uniref:NPCBM/NEW2 domain-containing protein n=1 Tax=Clostridium perfringens TaxID=1502 RepID=A0AAP4A635_CLOPF|nr:NPCBM/NEW2 domain-containing protein [Clostridium perfringens]MDH2335951.1 NPCBM/NEW2 domain-containing protein [Clostridium perfringens]
MKKKISKILIASMIISNASPVLNVYSSEVMKEKITSIEKSVINQTSINQFTLNSYKNFDEYNKKYKVQRNEIVSITNNGGQYSSSSIDKAIDGDLSTHWETGRQNSSNFTNEVVVEFNNLESIDRIAYATRQDGARGKGYPTEFDIYASSTGNEDDFKLVSQGASKSTGNLMEFKFDTVQAKKIKFVFKAADRDWASASEFWFYKEDKIMDKVNSIFTNEEKNKVNPEFDTVEKLDVFENEIKDHPFYEKFKEIIENAKLVLQGNNVVYKDALVSKFKDFNDESLKKYNELFKINTSSITTNGGNYAENSIERAIDGDVNTKWHSGKQNSSDFTNEVVITLDKLETLDRVVYTNLNMRGFAEAFDIYTSKTTSGDTFEKVTSGNSEVTKGSVEIKFNPTEARRVKFVFKKGYENWALASEFTFYKEDQLRDKMGRLFTDNTMSQISEEFNTLDKIEKLEAEAKEHPFYNDYKEELENAKLIIENKEVQYTDARVSDFLNPDNELLKAYDAVYKLDKSKIKSIKTNGGQYASESIDKAIDGDFNTKWHSGKQNTENFTNEVEIELEELTTLDRIVYTAPRGSNRGFAEAFDIYASRTTKGDNYQKVTSGNANITQNSVEIKFNPTEFKRIKFVFKKGYENWACASEFGLYKEDKTSDKVDKLFTNGLMNELSEDFNTEEKLASLEEEVKNHPLVNLYKEKLELAKEVLAGNAGSTVFELESRGNSIKESQKRKVWNFQDWQPTGYAVKSGQVITVYVDVEDGKPTPKLVFKQMDSQHNGDITISLNKGKNVITIPEKPTNELRPGTAKAGVLYTSNPYTSEEQGRKPKIRIEGAINYPHYIKGIDNDEEVMNELEEYVELLKKDPQLPDVFDVFSDKTLVNVTATYALNWYKDNNKLPSETANKSDEVIKETMRYWGFDESSEVNSDFKFRYISMLKWLDNGGFMNAGNGITGFNKAEQGGALGVNTGWGFMHEMGHNFDTNNRTIVEVTNNMLPLHFQRMEGTPSKITEQNLWERNILPKVALDDYSNNEYYPENDKSLLSHVAPLWQLQLYDETFWPRFEQEFRSRDIGGGSWENKHNAWVMAASDVFKLDLSEHFERHGMDVWKETKEYTSKYPKPSKKLWYANDKMYLNKGGVFTENLKYEAEAKIVNGNDVSISFAIDEENKNNVIGYEISRDGKTIGFTSTNNFVDHTATIGENHEYSIVAYDNEINPSKPYNFKLHAPSISAQQKALIALNEEFNPLDYVKAYNYEGNDISNKIEVTKNTVDNTKKGEYEVVYKVTDEKETKEKTLKVEVVSAYDYLSDEEWESVETQWGTPRRNTNIKGRVNGEVKTFEKGIGIHANGKVVYDLEGKDYDRFEALLGVDQTIEANNNSSISFKVIADGKTLETTKVLRYNDNMVEISIPVNGVNKLEIQVSDSGNGNTSDHGIIVNPKLSTNNVKPTITTEDAVINVKDKFDILDGVTAKDVEDGDLTSSIKVKSSDFEANRGGLYTVVYEVADKDGNIVTKERKIYTITTAESLSDKDWKSATSGWREVKKDLSVEGNRITLLGEDGQEVEYNKGLGTHANSEIVYDLSGKNYGMFETYVGVDREMRNSNEPSVIFEVYVDGKKVFDSGVMNVNSERKHVLIPIAGASELKLVAKDGGNGNAGDHADWADAKVYTTSDKPILTGEEVALNIGDSFDPLQGMVANDPEDGDITKNIKVINNNVNTKRGGNYVVSYEVTDSHGNKTTLDRKVAVVNAYDYISDKNWKSANSGWGSVQKDKSVENNTITLLGEDGQEVEYKKGIGTHATSTIVYDLSEGNYKFFESYVGVDREMRNSKVSSLSFEVYADGKKVFDSGVMNSDTPRKHVLIPVVGVSELKLVAKDGENGNGGDHADWADAKLLYADSKDFTALEKIVEEARGVEGNLYTEESFNKLQVALEKANKVLENPNPEQEVIDSTIIELRKAMDNLEAAIDLTEEVNIPDNELKRAIKDQLKLSSDAITRGDMTKLTSLSAVGYGIENLEGLQYAVNIEDLNLDCNEIRDISKIKDLKKLNNVSIKEQYIVIRSPEEVEGKYVINESFVGKEGERLSPKEINIRRNTGGQNVDISNVDVESSLNNGNLELDTKLFKEGFSGIAAVYEDLDGRYVATLSTIVSK